MDDYFEDSDAADEAYYDGYEEGQEDMMDGLSQGVEDNDMTEEEAFDTYDLAVSLGFGEEIGLEEAERLQAIYDERRHIAKNEKLEREEPRVRSLKSRHASADPTGGDSDFGSKYSPLTGKLKCPFEQWIKDVASGRKRITDPTDIDIFSEEF